MSSRSAPFFLPSLRIPGLLTNSKIKAYRRVLLQDVYTWMRHIVYVYSIFRKTCKMDLHTGPSPRGPYLNTITPPPLYVSIDNVICWHCSALFYYFLFRDRRKRHPLSLGMPYPSAQQHPPPRPSDVSPAKTREFGWRTCAFRCQPGVGRWR